MTSKILAQYEREDRSVRCQVRDRNQSEEASYVTFQFSALYILYLDNWQGQVVIYYLTSVAYDN